MDFAKKITIFLFLLTIVLGESNATLYTVGDSAGWTNHGVDYKSWAASKVFHVGDVFVFKYNKTYHNVVRVTHKNFNMCNATSPHKVYNSGFDTFTISKPGHLFFICGIGDHCHDGQRVDIRVVRSIQPPSSPPSISPPSPAPYVPVPVPIEPPYVPEPTPGSPGSFAPVPAPANSGSSKYPKIIGYTMFLTSIIMKIGWCTMF